MHSSWKECNYHHSLQTARLSCSRQPRLQNSPFLRIQVRASSQTKGLEWGWKQRARLGRDAKSFFSLASHALRACEARALRAPKTLTRSFTVFFTDFEKKKRLFCSLSLERNAGKDYLNMFTTPKYTVYDRITHFCKQPTQLYMSVQKRGNIRVNYK